MSNSAAIILKNRYDYINTSNPTTDVNPPSTPANWLNTTTGEEFVCNDNTTDNNVWVGSLGTRIPLDYALIFDGVDDYVGVPLGTIPLANETKTIFFRTKGFNSSSYFATLSTRVGVNTSKGFIIIVDQTSSGRITYNHTGKGDYIAYPSLDIYTEYCVAITTQDNGSSIKIYLDGVLLSPTTNTITTANAESTSGELSIGKQYTTLSEGYIRDVRIWNIELTQQQIQENMVTTLDGDETGLVAYYPFSTGSGGTLVDATANGNDGTINGAAWAKAVNEVTYKQV